MWVWVWVWVWVDVDVDVGVRSGVCLQAGPEDRVVLEEQTSCVEKHVDGVCEGVDTVSQSRYGS